MPKPLKRFRLGCIHCDRDDYDTVSILPLDWLRIAPMRNWAESLSPVDDSDPVERNMFTWQTHLGICPRCNTEVVAAKSEFRSMSLAVSCDYCGLTMDRRLDAYQYIDQTCCSVHCCRKSRVW